MNITAILITYLHVQTVETNGYKCFKSTGNGVQVHKADKVQITPSCIHTRQSVLIHELTIRPVIKIRILLKIINILLPA